MKEMDQLITAFGEFRKRTSRATERLANVPAMQEELEGLETSGTSREGTVTVTAGPGGSVKRISLTTAAMRQNPEDLERQIMSALQQAVAAAARKEAAVVEQHLGNGLRLSERVVETQAAALGTDTETLRTAIAEAERPPAPGHDDDNSQRSVKTDRGGGSVGDEFLRSLFERGES